MNPYPHPYPLEVLEGKLFGLKEDVERNESEVKYAHAKLEVAKKRVADTQFAINQLTVIFTSAASNGRE